MRRLIRQVIRNRFLRFGSIGLLCLVLIQLPVMQALMWAGVTALYANAAGFALSAVVNFFVQNRFTFDTEVKGNAGLGLAKFLGTSVLSLMVSSFVMGLVLYSFGGSFPSAVAFVRSAGFGMVDTWALLAAFIGGVSGAAFNFEASRFLRTFGRSNDVEVQEDAVPVLANKLPEVEEREVHPHSDYLRFLLQGRTLSVFMPAYKEADNLPTTVGELVAYLRELDLLEFKVIIVNDGSPDDTGAVADGLARAFPDEVMAIHHEVNQGYGGALITGFKAVVELGYDLWAFCDSDGQFDPKSFGTILEGLFDARGQKVADLTVGYRIGRRNSDSVFRYRLGRAWHFFGKFVVGNDADGNPLLSVDDVDCGIKGGSTKPLAPIVESLRGQAAAISPELIARMNMAGLVIVERGVTHLPRLAGTSTGDNLKVMFRSGVSIIKLGLRFRIERLFSWVSSPVDDAQEALEKEGWNR